ncbi:hypothetical protein QY049_04665 [Bradyrhizobium sp. WYCCWR 13022]|uniref:hypothetical protein n=1 Tax=unclassified Bradyrhizobium TaxID=2631580 RepID=UPI00263B00D5|nr:hypothetical protein [Bradyrhizobium sp. WYCCWR 13022]MDN4982518.1 hypothetical protein [Bradyrhizobium sp. WYCCWR 13022]
MNWQTLISTALRAIGFRKESEPRPRVYEGIRERRGEEAQRYLEQANRSLAKLRKKRDERAHECA